MSWGTYANTPILTYNQPPFGFAETITPPDFPTCSAEPYKGTEQLKADLNAKFAQLNNEQNYGQYEPYGAKGVETFCNARHTSNMWLWKIMWVVIIVYILYKLSQKN